MIHFFLYEVVDKNMILAGHQCCFGVLETSGRTGLSLRKVGLFYAFYGSR